MAQASVTAAVPPERQPWLICGTVPEASFGLAEGEWRLEGPMLYPETVRCPAEGERARGAAGFSPLTVRRGTPALLAAAWLTCRALGSSPPQALLAGDTGKGEGSRALYRHLADSLSDPAKAPGGQGGTAWKGITFHYLFPDVDGHNRVLMALESLRERPLLVADAGFMYVAKMSGYADFYDLFTPDAGEMAFLADEKAPHPFYTRGFLLSVEDAIPELVRRAHAHGNCARHLLVKGAADRIVIVEGDEARIAGEVREPAVETMEPIGGTGDLVTGIVTGLLAAGVPLLAACFVGARANRFIGQLAAPTPATQVAELLPFLPEALDLARKSGPAPAG